MAETIRLSRTFKDSSLDESNERLEPPVFVLSVYPLEVARNLQKELRRRIVHLSDEREIPKRKPAIAWMSAD